MRYTAHELKENVNISKKSPLRELFSLFISLLGIILIIYILLGFAVDIIAPVLPDTIDESLGKFYKPLYANTKAESKKVQELLNSLIENLEEKKQYEIFIIENKQVNALALPGRKIIIFSELLKEIEFENELAFVLAHELGHYAQRDHLKALGRRLVFFALSSLFLGQDNSVNDFIGNSLASAEMKFSQAQEKKADLFALDLLYEKYGHAGGATDFLEKMGEKEKLPKFLYFFTTHPHSENRIKAIMAKIKKQGYLIKKNIPLDKAYLSENKK